MPDAIMAADRGDADAQYYLAEVFGLGLGVGPDETQAAFWSDRAAESYRKAAKLGHEDAQYRLCSEGWAGKKVPSNAERVEWCLRAAEQGNSDAQRTLAGMYQFDTYGPQDLAKAAKWYRKAAIQNDHRSQFALADMYKLGQGVSKNYVEALKWYKLAAIRDSTNAQHDVSNAQYNVGFFYQNGQGVKQDFTQAAKWFRMAADLQNADARDALAALYETGRGVPKDAALAATWRQLADCSRRDFLPEPWAPNACHDVPFPLGGGPHAR